MWIFAIMSQLASCPYHRIGHHQTGDVAGAGVLVAGGWSGGGCPDCVRPKIFTVHLVSCKGESGEVKLSCG